MDGGDGVGDQEFKQSERGRGGARGQGRGSRGRGGRSRGTGRGGNSRPLQPASQRAAHYGRAEDVQRSTAGNPPTLSQLSRTINDSYPVSSEASSPLGDIVIDSKGYFEIALAVYRAIQNCWRDFETRISESEFLSVMGWFLVRKVIKARASLGIFVPDYMDFFHAMQEQEMPAILAEYLDAVGLIKLPDGSRCAPDLVVPCGARTDGTTLQGMVPIRLSNWAAFADNAMPNMTPTAYMMPFGLIMRRFTMAQQADPAVGALFLTRYNPANQQQQDVWLSRHNVLSCNPGNIRLPHAQRIGLVPFNNVYGSESFFGALCFSPDVLQTYVSLIPNMSVHMHFKEIGSDVKGSIAQVAYSREIALQAHGRPTRIEFHSSLELGEAELNAARTFKFRRATHVQHCVQNGDIDWPLGLSPYPIRLHANIRISTLETVGTYTTQIVSYYIKTKLGQRLG
uniref:Uncharacterized protein n=1 Tax=Anthurium amnicola TaxID=1678845 RepID=A0A1D1XS27_9ARAE